MQITTRFDIGQIVWAVRTTYRRVDCPACEGSGKLPGRNGGEYQCGNCNGSGQIKEENNQVSCWTVDGVTVSVFARQREQYSINGFILPAESTELFATKAEAQAECDRRNGEGW